MSESTLYRASFGSIRLWISKLDTDRSRSKVVHSPASGSNHVVQDRGGVVLRADATLLFDYMRGDTLTPVDRLNEFKALANSPDSYVLTHPIEGSFSASVENFRYGVDESGNLSAQCTFIADGEVPEAIPPGATGVPASGAGSVDAAADAYTAECADAGIADGGLGETAKTFANGWAEGAPTRQVLTETGSLSSQLSDKAATLSASHDNWQAFKNTLLLMESTYSAGKDALNGTLTNFVVRLGTNTSLRTLLAREYGADEVDLRYQQVLDLNDLRNPGMLDSGTELKLPSKTPSPRNG